MNALFKKIDCGDIAFDSKIFNSHIMALAAEESRLSGNTEILSDFENKYFI